jgi:CubicO group peptidase (beta-lactamase class C family)
VFLSRRGFLVLMAAGAAASASTAIGGTAVAAVSTRAERAAGGDDPGGGRRIDGDFLALRGCVDEKMRLLQVPGVAIGVLHGDREYVDGFGVTNVDHPLRVDGDTLFQIGSVTKTYTGTALMRLVEAGQLDLDTPVRRWLPDLALADPAAAAAVTPRHLVTHTGGWFGDHALDTGTGDDALARYVADLAALPQQAPPGRFFGYNNAGMSLAGKLIEVATGVPFEAAIRELILASLNQERACFFAADAITMATAVGHTVEEGGARVARPWGIPRGVNPAGGLIASAREQLAWARFHLGDGVTPSGERLLTPATMALMQSPLGPGGTLGADEIDGVGINWLLKPLGDARVVFHDGATNGQRSALLLVPARRFALVILTNADTGARLASEVAAWALRRFLGLAGVPPVPAPLPADRLAPYVGRYASPALELRVGAGDGVVLLQGLQGGEPLPGLPQFRFGFYGEDRAVALDEFAGGTRCDFLRHPDGAVGWLRLGGRLLARDAPPA